jgi:hypothetical protein
MFKTVTFEELASGAISQLTGLKRLRCSHNRLTSGGVPWKALCSLVQLTRLSLDHNCFVSLDPALFQACALSLSISLSVLNVVIFILVYFNCPKCTFVAHVEQLWNVVAFIQVVVLK